ncbi:MAG: hypothetical protein QM668_03190 [Agriterribacter sp.]
MLFIPMQRMNVSRLGKPVFPIEERKMPLSFLAGEQASPTQPFPVKPQPFVRQYFSDNDIARLSDSSYSYLKEKIKFAKKGAVYIHPIPLV